MNRFKVIKLTLSVVIVGLISLGIVLPLSVANKPYNFRETAVKVMGSSGHGSGSIVDSTLEKSLILTNRHVCNRATLTQEERLQSQRLQSGLLACMFGMNPECRKAITAYKSFMESLDGTGKTMTIKFNNLDLPDIKGIVKVVSKHADLCLVEIPKGLLPIIKISKRKARPGDKVIALGNPLDMTNHMTDGYVGDEIEYQGNKYQHHTAEFYAGSSGSATVNMSKELVGVNTLGTKVATQGYMINLTDIILFLQGNMLVRKINTEIE